MRMSFITRKKSFNHCQR